MGWRVGLKAALPSRHSAFGRLCFSGGSLVFLVRSSGDDPDRIIRQRPLQRLCLIPWAHPVARESLPSPNILV